MSTTTKHTCGGPVFGKRTAGCPRCDELAAGAAPVKWNGTQPVGYECIGYDRVRVTLKNGRTYVTTLNGSVGYSYAAQVSK